MHRLTISLPDDLADAVEQEADRLGTSISDVVRRAILRAFHEEPARPLPFAGLGASGQRTTARDAEEILTREWTIDRRR
jgi:Arc/MetJ-type ribon-helix-helix transcriptional regulator